MDEEIDFDRDLILSNGKNLGLVNEGILKDHHYSAGRLRISKESLKDFYTSGKKLTFTEFNTFKNTKLHNRNSHTSKTDPILALKQAY